MKILCTDTHEGYTIQLLSKLINFTIFLVLFKFSCKQTKKTCNVLVFYSIPENYIKSN